MEIPLAQGFYVSDSLPVSAQECINWVPVRAELPALSQMQLRGTAGIDLLTSSGDADINVNRGSWDLAGIPYFVNGNNLYRLNISFTPTGELFTLTNLGTITGIGRVVMADNGTQLMILVPGGDGFIYTVAGGLVQITDADFYAHGNPQSVVFIDSYFVCTTDTKEWIVSNINNGLAWDALDFGTAEADPDIPVAPVVNNNQLFITGSETTEGFQNIGGTGFPFQRNNIFLDKGCYAPFSLISSNERFFMIGGGKNESPAIWAYQGGGYQKVSTTVIDSILSTYTKTNIALTFSLSWSIKGQYFVCFILPDRAFTYNITTGLWHEQKSGVPDSFGDLVQTRWRVNSLVTAYGYLLVGDYADGRIGKLNTSTYKEYGYDIVRIFSPPPIANGGKSFRIPRIELTMEAGVGNVDIEDPKVSLAISKDAKLFNYERNRRIGKIGAYNQRTIWRRNGRYPRMCVLKFRLSDPVKPVVIKLEAEII